MMVNDCLFSLYRTTLHSLKSQWVRVGCIPASLRRFILHHTNRAVRESKSMWPVKHVHTNSLRKPLLSILCVRSWIVWLSLCLYVLVCVLPRCLFSVLLPHVCPSPQFSSVSCERLMLCALFVPCLVSYMTEFAAFGCTSHLPTCQIVTLSAKNSKNESSSYEPGNSIIYLFCLFSTYNRIELCEVRLNPKTFKFLLQSLTKLKTKTSAGELQPPGVWLRSLHITDTDKETFHTQSLTPCLIRLFDHSYAESLQLVGPHVCLCGQKIESPCKQYWGQQRVFPTSRSLHRNTVWAEQIHYKVSSPRWRGSKGSQRVK